VASIGGYFYATGDDVIAVHLYGSSTAKLSVAGQHVTLRQTADYPWSGKISIAVEPEAPAEFALKLRIPGWAHGETLKLNGKPLDSVAKERGYVEIRRRWSAGDTVELDLPMPVERIYAHPDVRMDIGRVALKRGPLVYCIEQADNSGAVPRLKIGAGATLVVAERPDLFGGIVTVVADGSLATADDWDGSLYRTAPVGQEPARLTAIPYYLWANREPGPMRVWIPQV
jgi:DUF1680 family protein